MPHTILLVDDDRTFCAALAGALRRRGHTVLLAHDYDDALSEAQAWSPDRAVIDLRMPGRGGLEVVQALRATLPQLRMVVLTGYGSIATAVEAVKLGATYYLTKPTTADQVVAAFDRKDASVDVPLAVKPLSVDRLEWEHIQRVLTNVDGNISAAARALNMHRRTLQRKLNKYPPRS